MEVDPEVQKAIDGASKLIPEVMISSVVGKMQGYNLGHFSEVIKDRKNGSDLTNHLLEGGVVIFEYSAPTLLYPDNEPMVTRAFLPEGTSNALQIAASEFRNMDFSIIVGLKKGAEGKIDKSGLLECHRVDVTKNILNGDEPCPPMDSMPMSMSVMRKEATVLAVRAIPNDTPSRSEAAMYTWLEGAVDRFDTMIKYAPDVYLAKDVQNALEVRARVKSEFIGPINQQPSVNTQAGGKAEELLRTNGIKLD